jgi:hypothetical protein
LSILCKFLHLNVYVDSLDLEELCLWHLQWFLRDFTGMLGSILFTLQQGSNLDSSAKQWRLAADLMNDMGKVMMHSCSYHWYEYHPVSHWHLAADFMNGQLAPS